MYVIREYIHGCANSKMEENTFLRMEDLLLAKDPGIAFTIKKFKHYLGG